MGKSREAHAGAVSALITFGLRALPFLAFSGSRKMPASLERLGQALPSAIMAVLIIYCMKDIPTGGISAAVPKLLADALPVHFLSHHSTQPLVNFRYLKSY